MRALLVTEVDFNEPASERSCQVAKHVPINKFDL